MEQIHKLKTTCNLVSVLHIVEKIPEKFFPYFISINWPSLVTLWVAIKKINSKMHPVSKTNTHHGVIIDLVNHGMFKNTNTWLSWEWYITFLWNKKILNLCLRWHILRNYHFLAEVTFKNWMQKNRWKAEAIKNRLLLLFTVYIIDVSNKLNKNLSVISLELIGVLTFLLCVSSDMKTNPFITWLRMYTPISNLKLK